MAAAVELAGVARRFGATNAVADLSLRVERGEIFALVGPDGAGKTTLIRLVCGALAADAGTLLVDGIDVRAHPDAVQASVGYMPQRFSLYPDLSVMENLRFYGAIFGVARERFQERARTLLADFSLAAFGARPAGDLSGGMKQKLALACALIHSPATILLDEPTAGVDPLSRHAFWQILRDINARGTTILVSTTYMDEAERANRVAFLNGGSVLVCGTPAELKAQLQGDVVEITAADRAAVRRALRAVPIVRSLEVFGETLHALVPAAQTAIPELERLLSQAGVAGARLRRIEPSLEDTFVARLTP